jgi:hypothetical protein
MSDGATHYKYFMQGYKYIAVQTAAMYFCCGSDVALFFLAGYSTGRWIDPDWDLAGASEAEGRQLREIPVFGWLLFAVSSFYGGIFRHQHRKPITHWPLLSTAIRLLFVFAAPVALMWWLGFPVLSPVWLEMYIWFWIGLSEADAIHYWLDIKSNEKLRKKKKR